MRSRSIIAKNWTLVILGLVSAITLASCGDDDPAAPAPPPAATNKVLQLDGTGDYLSIPILNQNFTEFTLEVLVKVSTYDANVHYLSLYQNAYLVLGDYSTGQVSTWAAGLTPIDVGPGSTPALSTDAWHHFAMSYDGTNQYILIDGVVVVTAPTTGAVINDSGTYDGGLTVGARFGGAQQFVTGQIDEVRIWNIYRTPAEVLSNMNKAISGNTSGLVGYWNFDDGTASDKTAYDADGTLAGDAVIVNK